MPDALTPARLLDLSDEELLDSDRLRAAVAEARSIIQRHLDERPALVEVAEQWLDADAARSAVALVKAVDYAAREVLGDLTEATEQRLHLGAELAAVGFQLDSAQSQPDPQRQEEAQSLKLRLDALRDALHRLDVATVSRHHSIAVLDSVSVQLHDVVTSTPDPQRTRMLAGVVELIATLPSGAPMVELLNWLAAVTYVTNVVYDHHASVVDDVQPAPSRFGDAPLAPSISAEGDGVIDVLPFAFVDRLEPDTPAHGAACGAIEDMLGRLTALRDRDDVDGEDVRHAELLARHLRDHLTRDGELLVGSAHGNMVDAARLVQRHLPARDTPAEERLNTAIDNLLAPRPGLDAEATADALGDVVSAAASAAAEHSSVDELDHPMTTRPTLRQHATERVLAGAGDGIYDLSRWTVLRFGKTVAVGGFLTVLEVRYGHVTTIIDWISAVTRTSP